MVVGAAAAGAAVTGNPVLIGLTDGANAQSWKQSSAATGTTGAGIAAVSLLTKYTGSANYSEVLTGRDTADNNNFTAAIAVVPAICNSGASGAATYDRPRNNIDATLLTSAARTTTQGPTNITTYNARAIYVILDMTNVAAAPSVTLKIDMIDPVSAKAVNLLTGVAVTTVSTNIYKIGVGLTAAANLVASEYLPRTIAITVTANNANSGTYSVGYSLIAA